MARRKMNDYAAFVAARMHTLKPRGMAESRAAMRTIAAEWRAMHHEGRERNPGKARRAERKVEGLHRRWENEANRLRIGSKRFFQREHTAPTDAYARHKRRQARKRNPSGGPSLGMLALLGVGAYLLLRKGGLHLGAQAGPVSGSVNASASGVSLGAGV